jgi:hypothetical protein
VQERNFGSQASIEVLGTRTLGAMLWHCCPHMNKNVGNDKGPPRSTKKGGDILKWYRKSSIKLSFV